MSEQTSFSVYSPTHLIHTLDQLAEAERRSRSQIACILMQEAIDARERKQAHYDRILEESAAREITDVPVLDQATL